MARKFPNQPTLDLAVIGDGRLGRPELGSSSLSYRFGRVVTASGQRTFQQIV